MKKYLILIMIVLFSYDGYSQDKCIKDITVPHITLPNGISAEFSINYTELVLNCFIDNNDSSFCIAIDIDGITINEKISEKVTDSLQLDLSSINPGKYNIIIRTEDETFDAGSIEVSTNNN